MGKGDRKTRKGKIFAGSFGKYRPKAKNTVNKEVAATSTTTETKAEEKTEA